VTPRRSGIIAPLFSLVSSRGWGIGEFLDLPEWSRWSLAAGQSVLQLLPLGEMPPGERSPYSAMTAMALDPIYIALPRLDDFAAIGGEGALDAADRATLDAVRRAPRVRHADVRRLKTRWLRRSWDRFRDAERGAGTARATHFQNFRDAEAWWLDEYTVFRALHARFDERAWSDWPSPLRAADAAAVGGARGQLGEEMDYYAYLQWVAAGQWAEARRSAAPLRIFGDLPFMVAADSPDVWARQDEFRFDGTIGVPPDAFSETGQNWGLPPWRWEVMAANGFAWMRRRARRQAELYDGFRIDHLVGLYRIYVRPFEDTVEPFFDPGDEASQRRLGETLAGIALDTGAEVIAEDLGVIPDYVRASMVRLGLPGLKVLRWERHWDQPAQPPIDPVEFPEVSVAATGTHDIEPLACTDEGATEAQRTAILESLLAAGSRLALMPLQDVFGWTDRINTPAVVDDINWTWRVPSPIDTWMDRDDIRRRAADLLARTQAAGRWPVES